MKSVTDALRRLDGAGDIAVDLQAGRVTLRPDPGARFRPEDVSRAVRGAGYPTGEIRVTATGEAAEEGGRWVFRLPGDSEPYLVADRGPAAGARRVTARFHADGTVSLEDATGPP